MTTIIIIILLLIVGFFTYVKIKHPEIGDPNLKDDAKPNHNICYSLREYYLSPAEYSFFKSLICAAPKEVIVFAKVRIGDVVKGEGHKYANNSINQKHFDFLICDSLNVKPLFAIELDDSSHNSKKTKNRDLLVNNVCEQAAFKLVRVKAKYNYSIDELKTLFNSSEAQA